MSCIEVNSSLSIIDEFITCFSWCNTLIIYDMNFKILQKIQNAYPTSGIIKEKNFDSRCVFLISEKKKAFRVRCNYDEIVGIYFDTVQNFNLIRAENVMYRQPKSIKVLLDKTNLFTKALSFKLLLIKDILLKDILLEILIRYLSIIKHDFNLYTILN